MKSFIAVLSTLLLAVAAQADPYSMAKQQAKNVANGDPVSSRPTPPTPPQQNNPPANPELEATLHNISDLRANFAALNSATNLDGSLKQSLINNLTAAAQGAYPATDSVKKLADDLIAATMGKDKMRAQQQKLAQMIHAIFNSSHLSTTQQETIFNEVKKILESGGASSDDIEKVIADIKEIAAQTK